QTLAPERVKKSLLELGLQPNNRGYNGMLLDRGRFRPVSPLPELNVQKVVDGRTLREFMTVFQTGFEISGSSAEYFENYYIARMGAALREALFVGYSNGRPVSISAYNIDDGVIMIHSVSTLPEFRQKGYGGFLTQASIIESLRCAELPVTLYGSE